MSNDLDVFDDGETFAPEDKLNRLHTMAAELAAMNETIDAAEAQLDAMKSARHALRTGPMPKLMTDLQMPQFVFNQIEFELGDLVTGSFPKEPEKREIAVALLKEYGADGMIVSSIEVVFPKSEHHLAEALFKQLQTEGHTVNLSETIHPQTYNAFGRQRLADGEEIDFDGLGMRHYKLVKTKEVKEKPKRVSIKRLG